MLLAARAFLRRAVRPEASVLLRTSASLAITPDMLAASAPDADAQRARPADAPAAPPAAAAAAVAASAPAPASAPALQPDHHWVNHPSHSSSLSSHPRAEEPHSLPAQLRAWKREKGIPNARLARSASRRGVPLTPSGRRMVIMPPAPWPETCASSPQEAQAASEQLAELLAVQPKHHSHDANNQLWQLYLSSSYLVPAREVRSVSKAAADILLRPRVRSYLADSLSPTGAAGDGAEVARLAESDEATGAKVRVSALPVDMLVKLLERLAPNRRPEVPTGSFPMYPIVKRYTRRALSILAQVRAQRLFEGTLAAAVVPGSAEQGAIPPPSVKTLLTVLEWAQAQTQAEVVDDVLALLRYVPQGTQGEEVQEAVRRVLVVLKRSAAHAAVFLSARQCERGKPRRALVWDASKWNATETICASQGEQALALLSEKALSVSHDTAAEAVMLFARTSQLGRAVDLLREHWDVDLLRPDLPLRSADVPPLPTELFNTILFALGQQLPVSEMVAAFFTLTEPMSARSAASAYRTVTDTEPDEAHDGQAQRQASVPDMASYETMVHHLVNPIKGRRYRGREGMWTEILPRARVRETFEVEQRRRQRGSYALLLQLVLDQALDQAARNSSEYRKRVLTVLAIERRPVALREAGIEPEDLVDYAPTPSELLLPTNRLLRWALHLAQDRGRASLINYLRNYTRRWLELMEGEQVFLSEARKHVSHPALLARVGALVDAYNQPLGVVRSVERQLAKKQQAVRNKKHRSAVAGTRADRTVKAKALPDGEAETGAEPGTEAPVEGEAVKFVDLGEVTTDRIVTRERKLRGKERRAVERELLKARNEELEERYRRGG